MPASPQPRLCIHFHCCIHWFLWPFPVQEVFPVLLPALSFGPRDKEVSEFRSLLHTVFSCLKSVLYCMVAFHTNRGLQAPASFVGERGQACLAVGQWRPRCLSNHVHCLQHWCTQALLSALVDVCGCHLLPAAGVPGKDMERAHR